MQAQTVDCPPLQLRAALASVNEEARTVDVIFSTGAGVERYDWRTGGRFIEKLAITEKAMRLQRLNAGASVLDAHSAWSVSDILGSIAPGTAHIEGGKAVATLRFSRREMVEPIWMDIVDGHIRFVSVGYQVHKFEEEPGGANKLPVRLATDWEPFEVSMVPMPADAGAKVRAGQPVEFNKCVIVRAVSDQDRTRALRLAQARA